MPAGVWLRHTDHDPLAARHHRAVETVPTDPHLFLLVLGSPGTPPLALDDVAQFWDTVLPGVRPAARFVLHGSPTPLLSQEPGQTLADVLNHQVTLYDALPYAEPEGRPVPAESTYLPSGTLTPGITPGSAPQREPASGVPSPPPIRTESGVGAPHAETGTTDLPETLTSPDDSGDTDLSEAPTVRNDGGTQLPAPAPAPEPATNGAADLEEAPTIRNARRTRAARPRTRHRHRRPTPQEYPTRRPRLRERLLCSDLDPEPDPG